ncbi:MAG: hypothetical protein HN348_15020, partial [Proteobacteria bacterium]|nr:hypothetical protein [Pseudomonadota bacterium]
MGFWLGLGVVAEATVPDKFGIGARSMGSGGGGVALVNDGTAALLNPAGLAQVRRPLTSVGISGAFHSFEDMPGLYWDTNRDGVIDEKDDALQYNVNTEPAVGLQIQMARQIGGKMGMGFVAY